MKRLLPIAAAIIGLALGTAADAREALRLEGELIARESAALMPPAVGSLWQLNITRLAPDGAPVKQGEPVLSFDGGQLQQQLMTKQSQLQEKLSQREKLLLELAERERSERLATEERRAQRDKAQRKASQPEDLVRRVDYRKLTIERAQAERQLALTEQRERLAAEQRRQEKRLVDAEIALLESDVEVLKAGIAELNVLAPRDGVMLHRSNWQGEKYDVGAQVWRGQTVAEIPDLSTLEVRALLPERDMLRVREGMAVRVRIEGSGVQVSGRIAEVARTVRSKSRLQPIPVIDLRIMIDELPAGLKPGQAVRVDVPDATPAAIAGEAA